MSSPAGSDAGHMGADWIAHSYLQYRRNQTDETTMDMTDADLVIEIRSAHKLAETSSQYALDNAIYAGKLLLEAKRRLVRGSFGEWLTANFQFTHRTAQTYMRIAKKDPAQIRSTASHLSIRSVLKEGRKQVNDKQTTEKPKRKSSRPTISDAEYRSLRQKAINSAIARSIPSVKRAAESLLGTDELMQLRTAICAVIDQYINRSDDSARDKTQLTLVKKESAA